MSNSATYLAKFLEQQKTTHVFELVGGMITFLLDALHQHTNIEVVSMHHEQGAAFAAEGYGRMKGLPGVAMATSGPGATNLLTGIGSCYFDSTPALFVTGQVNTHEMKGVRGVRQLGFQETDIVSMAGPVTKGTWQVSKADEVPVALSRAYELALSGRPGPVLVDIPMDVQRGRTEQAALPLEPPVPTSFSDAAGLREMFAELREARRPLFLVGNGVRGAGNAAVDALRKLVDGLGVPTVNSLMAVDALPVDCRFRVGLIGSYGNRWANQALHQSDFLVVLGSRLDVRQTGANAQDFKGERPIWHVDCDPSEVNNRVQGCRFINSHLAPFLEAAAQSDEAGRRLDIGGWLRQIDAQRRERPDTQEGDSHGGIHPNVFMHALSEASRQAAGYVVDVGQHQMWAAQSLDLRKEQRFLTSGGMGSMGFALPAAIGASCAANNAPMVVVAGDGSFQCNVQELQTVVRGGLPLKMVVINNGTHGMVRQFQESYFEGRYHSTMWGYSAPSFTRLAQAYGLEAACIDQPSEVETALARMWEDPLKPYLLEVRVDAMVNAYPKLAFGRSLADMEPDIKSAAMEST